MLWGEIGRKEGDKEQRKEENKERGTQLLDIDVGGEKETENNSRNPNISFSHVIFPYLSRPVKY